MTDEEPPEQAEPPATEEGDAPEQPDATEGDGTAPADEPASPPTDEELFYANAVRTHPAPFIAVAAIIALAVLAFVVVRVTGSEDAEDPERRAPAVDSALALQTQVRRFADAWVTGDLEAASGYAGVCVSEKGQQGTQDLLRATLDLVEVAYGVPTEELVVRRVVTRNVAGGSGEARIDFEPAPFEDPLEAVGQFLPWSLDGSAWGLATCTFGDASAPPEDPDSASRADLIRSMLDLGYGEELAICVADALIGDFGLAAITPGKLNEQQESVRLASEATCRSVPTQAGEGFGTPDNPVPYGSVGQVGEWEARVVDLIPDATEIVMEAFDFNDPPPEDEQFVLVRLELTYRGEQEAATLLDLGFRLETADGRTYDEFDDTCGLFPDEIDQVAPTAPGEQRSGTMCWSVAKEDVASLRLLLDSLVTLDEGNVWFALG